MRHAEPMRANYKLQRLYVDQPLSAQSRVPLDRKQTNYLLNVLRMQDGDELLLFNGTDGEWRASIEKTSKKTADLICRALERPQPEDPDLTFCFAPLKVGRLDYVVQKSVEMGAGVIQPVLTDFTQYHKLSVHKVRAWAIEASEQCGVLSIPQCQPPITLDAMLRGWDRRRALFFCDEDSETDNPLGLLTSLKRGKTGVLIGPEGGFSQSERDVLRALDFVVPIPLGPRILRADTAAVAALALVQATVGDWDRREP